MKHRGRSIALVLAGVLIGCLFSGPAVAAASELVNAYHSNHTVYVDGKAIELEAYVIDGNNYVKLRDIGKAVDFNVYWDDQSRTVQVASNLPYTGLAPERTVPAKHSTEEYNTAVLTDAFTCEAYEALRSAIVSRSESEAVHMSPETREAMLEAEAAVGCWPVFDLAAKGNCMYSFAPRYPDSYEEAAAICSPFVESLSDKDDREKIREMVFFVCDRIEYDANTYCSPRTALVSDNAQKGACMSYAHCFKFLCDLADIPCIFIHSENHQWNQVYIEGHWWHVDVTSADACDSNLRPKLPILYKDSEMQGSMYLQSQPWLTELAKELMVPGSTIQ